MSYEEALERAIKRRLETVIPPKPEKREERVPVVADWIKMVGQTEEWTFPRTALLWKTWSFVAGWMVIDRKLYYVPRGEHVHQALYLPPNMLTPSQTMAYMIVRPTYLSRFVDKLPYSILYLNEEQMTRFIRETEDIAKRGIQNAFVTMVRSDFGENILLTIKPGVDPAREQEIEGSIDGHHVIGFHRKSANPIARREAEKYMNIYLTKGIEEMIETMRKDRIFKVRKYPR